MIVFTPPKIIRYSALSIFLIGACATNVTSIPIAIDYKVLDRPEKQQLILTYTNYLKEDLCIPFSVFPEDGEIIGWGRDKVQLLVGGVTYPMLDMDPGFCDNQSCGVKVAKGSEITGLIPYSHFDLPQEKFYETKILKYRINGYVCND